MIRSKGLAGMRVGSDEDDKWTPAPRVTFDWTTYQKSSRGSTFRESAKDTQRLCLCRYEVGSIMQPRKTEYKLAREN